MRFLQALAAALVLLPLLAIQAVAQDYRLRPGDTVQVEVLEDASLNRTAIVLPDGQISLPLAGTIRAGGRTLAQVENSIESRLAPNFAAPPTVFVTLSSLAEREEEEERTIDIFVAGEAENEGLIEMPPGSTLLQAIAAAGLTPFAAKKRIQLRRVDHSGVERVYQFNYDAVERGAIALRSTVLTDGDVIVVPTRRLFE